jgi:hypothetical protein
MLTGILETWWLNSYLVLGLDAVPLGMPKEIEGMSLLAVSFPVDEKVRDNLKARLASAVVTTRERHDRREHPKKAA